VSERRRADVVGFSVTIAQFEENGATAQERENLRESLERLIQAFRTLDGR
jgi:hypothetical protein